MNRNYLYLGGLQYIVREVDSKHIRFESHLCHLYHSVTSDKSFKYFMPKLFLFTLMDNSNTHFRITMRIKLQNEYKTISKMLAVTKH